MPRAPRLARCSGSPPLPHYRRQVVRLVKDTPPLGSFGVKGEESHVQIGNRLNTTLRAFLQASFDQLHQLLWHLWTEHAQRLGRSGANKPHRVGAVHATERALSRKHLKQDDPERPYICPCISVAKRFSLLRGNICWSSNSIRLEGEAW